MMTAQLTSCAASLASLVNRVAFVVGDDVSAQSPVTNSICSARQSPPEIHLVPSGSSARLAGEFAAAGFSLSSRLATHETWRSAAGHSVHLAVPAPESESEWGVATEYATLLTTTVTLKDSPSIRVASTVAQLAYIGAVHRLNAWSLLKSGAGEQFVRMILTGIAGPPQVAAAPAELRAVVAKNAEFVIRDPSLGFLLHRLIRGARAHGSASAIALPAIEALIAA